MTQCFFFCSVENVMINNKNDPTTSASGEAEDEDVPVPYEPLASQQFIQEYNRMIAVEGELRQKLQQSEAQLRTMPHNMSSFHLTQGTIYTAL